MRSTSRTRLERGLKTANQSLPSFFKFSGSCSMSRSARTLLWLRGMWLGAINALGWWWGGGVGLCRRTGRTGRRAVGFFFFLLVRMSLRDRWRRDPFRRFVGNALVTGRVTYRVTGVRSWWVGYRYGIGDFKLCMLYIRSELLTVCGAHKMLVRCVCMRCVF